MNHLLAINWSNVGLQVGQLLLALSILILLHEWGHFFFARLFKTRVSKFYLFFDFLFPFPNLLKFSIFKKKKGDTEYGLGWFPLGGYVQIDGMIDESMDKEKMKQPPQPWEFRSKPAWQRLIIMLGGIIMNVLVAFVIYAFVLMVWGDKKIPASSLKYGVHVVDSTLYKVGIRNGDRVIAVNGEPVQDFEKMFRSIIVADNLTVERNGQQVNLKLPVDILGQLIENRKKDVSFFLEPRIPVQAFIIPDTSRAYKAGLRKNDFIIGVDSTRFTFYDEYKNEVLQHKGQNINLIVKRDSQEITLPVAVDSEGKIGFVAYGYGDYQQMDSLGWLKLNVKKYGFFAAFPAGVRKTGEELSSYIAQFKKIINPRTGGYKGVGGFKAIGSVFPKYGWDWEAFWRITALLSIILAFMNLLPIPALDGGHVLFVLYEMITRRKPNEKFLEYAQIAGMIVLFALMIYANGNDWFGWGK